MIRALTPHEARALVAQEDVEIVDVREPREWSGGHVPGARHVPFDRLRSSVKTSLPRDGVIFVCTAGVRSEAAARLAEAHGLTKIYNLTGGTRGWASAGLPLVRETA
jgi:rhodanese-related sulfurtransferase